MVLRRKNFPEVGDIVVATVREIFDFGAFTTLDEYNNIKAYLPWSEISTKWIKNIRDLIKENQKIIAKVIRVDNSKGNVDISMKKVNEDEKRKKIIEWKRAQKAHKILEVIANKLNKPVTIAYNEVGWKLEDRYGEIMKGLEEIAKNGEIALKEIGVPEQWWKLIIEEARKHVEEKLYEVSAQITLRSYSPNGIELIKKVLSLPIQISSEKGIKCRVYTIGSPRYRIDIYYQDPKKASEIMDEIINEIKFLADNLGLEFNASKVKEK
jgi:translation initiation factor 2 subunit 1